MGYTPRRVLLAVWPVVAAGADEARKLGAIRDWPPPPPIPPEVGEPTGAIDGVGKAGGGAEELRIM